MLRRQFMCRRLKFTWASDILTRVITGIRIVITAGITGMAVITTVVTDTAVTGMGVMGTVVTAIGGKRSVHI